MESGLFLIYWIKLDLTPDGQENSVNRKISGGTNIYERLRIMTGPHSFDKMGGVVYESSGESIFAFCRVLQQLQLTGRSSIQCTTQWGQFSTLNLIPISQLADIFLYINGFLSEKMSQFGKNVCHPWDNSALKGQSLGQFKCIWTSQILSKSTAFNPRCLN